MKKPAGILIACFFTLAAAASTVDTVSIYSKAMGKSLKCVVISPGLAVERPTPIPVVYLLHGYDGWYSNWIIRAPELMQYADDYRVMIVCPEGHKSSWYFDSPIDSTMRYETFVAKEVPEYIDKHYGTVKDRTGRAITGLSMGGHGGLFLGFRNADIFGACGSMSGNMDLNASRNKYLIEKRIGDTVNYFDNWKNYSVITAVENKPKEPMTIIFDCGIDDGFIAGNRALHEKMLKLKIPHEYIERPGNHGWTYWRNSVKYQIFFFRNYFDSNRR